MKKMFATLAIASLSVLSAVRAATITENFTNNPSQDGWQIFGNTNQFQWDSTNQNLDITWDSTKSNSYFYHPLGTTLTRNDDFSIAFDLRLNDIASGNEPGKTGPMQLGFGFLNFTNATSTNFHHRTPAARNIAAPSNAVIIAVPRLGSFRIRPNELESNTFLSRATG